MDNKGLHAFVYLRIGEGFVLVTDVGESEVLWPLIMTESPKIHFLPVVTPLDRIRNPPRIAINHRQVQKINQAAIFCMAASEFFQDYLIFEMALAG